MFETLKRLYEAGRLSAQGIERAVALGWIEHWQAGQIAGGEG